MKKCVQTAGIAHIKENGMSEEPEKATRADL
jgi:hypothetical protein